jgi:hypothetical protein
MKALFFAILFFIMFASAIYGKETLKSNNSPQTEEEAERYFVECEAISASDLKDEKAPTFVNYSMPSEAPVERPKVDTKTTMIGRTYRTVLKKSIASGANFAGHYNVGVWGCGSSCSTFAVVNLKTGQIIVPNGIRSVSGLHLDNTVEQFLPEGQHGYWGYRYKLDSRLLVLVGMLNEDEKREGAYYFVMDNNRLKQVHQTHVAKKCNS